MFCRGTSPAESGSIYRAAEGSLDPGWPMANGVYSWISRPSFGRVKCRQECGPWNGTITLGWQQQPGVGYVRSKAKPLWLLIPALGLVLAGCTSAVTSDSPPSSPTAAKEDPSSPGETSNADADTTAEPSPSPKPEKVLYLTFDDGPALPDTDQLLKILAESDAKATFFVNGNMVQANPKQAKAISAGGHAIGNHTYNHPHLPTLSDSEVRKQLADTAKAVGPAMGACMRPPYLDTDPRIRKLSKEAGYATIMGDLAAQDWTTPPVDTLVDSLRAQTTKKNVIILHDGPTGRQNTIAAMKKLVPEWTKEGWTLAALPKCAKPLATDNT